MSDLYHWAPLILIGLMSIGIAMERYIALAVRYPMKKNGEVFFQRIRSMVHRAEVHKAIEECRAQRGKPVSGVVAQALARADQPESVIADSLAVAVSQASREVQKRIPYLAALANAATLIGLFGTIQGLIISFQSMADADAAQRSARMAEGVSSALHATLFGLMIAIPTVLVYSYLASKANRQVSEIEEAGARAMEIIKEHYYAETTEVLDVRKGA